MASDLKNILNIENRTKYFYHLLVIIFIISWVFFGFLIYQNEKNKKRVVPHTDPFAEIEIGAKGAIVWDIVNQREIFNKNANTPLPLASLTKVMTALTSSVLPDNLKIKVVPDYLKPEGDSGLVVGDTWQLKDLRDFTLLTSSNDGALALASVTEKASPEINSSFTDLMNQEASKIGLTKSHFFNPHGLDRSTSTGPITNLTGAYGSAKDVALLFEYILRHNQEILEATHYKNLTFRSNDKTYNAQNTNVSVDKIPNLIASKTGFTDLAGGNLAIVFDAGINRPIAVVILGSTETGRFEDTLKLVKASLIYISNE